MSFEEMVVAVVGTVAGVGLVGYLAAKIFGVIKAWINRNNSSIQEEQFDRLAKAFMQYKKDTENRLQNLEAIIADEDAGSKSRSSKQSKQIEAPKQNIEVEDRETEQEQSGSGSNNSLNNMLQE